jgi:hypothetical protein
MKAAIKRMSGSRRLHALPVAAYVLARRTPECSSVQQFCSCSRHACVLRAGLGGGTESRAALSM